MIVRGVRRVSGGVEQLSRQALSSQWMSETSARGVFFNVNSYGKRALTV